MKILCTADVHIGRRSSRLPAHADGHLHSCSAAWLRIVDRALADGVDLVTVSGDLVDQADRYLEAIGPLESGLRRLAGAGIPVVVVSGNHDHDVLPALVDSIDSPSIRLLGRGGRWERWTVESAGGRVHVDGWSFPQAQHRVDPVQTYQPLLDGTPVLALLHCDVDQPGSRYAPVSLAELRRHPEVFFVLGHVHAGRRVEEPRGARWLYPGSPQAMDPGETGEHGVWVVEVDREGMVARSIPISTVRYEALEVSVEGAESLEEVENRLYSAVRMGLDSLQGAAGGIRSVRYRVGLTGATRMRRELEGRLSEVVGDLELSSGEMTASIEGLRFETGPAHDLEALAGGIGPPAVLARLLGPAGVDEGMRTALRRAIAEVQDSRAFVEVHGGGEELAELEAAGLDELRRSATLLLDELLLQKPS